MFIDSCCKQILCFSYALTLCATRHHLQVLPKVILSAARHKCLWWGSLKKGQRKGMFIFLQVLLSYLHSGVQYFYQRCIHQWPHNDANLYSLPLNSSSSMFFSSFLPHSKSLASDHCSDVVHFSVLEWNHDSEGFKCHSHTKKTPVRKYSVVPSDYKDMSCEIIGWWI